MKNKRFGAPGCLLQGPAWETAPRSFMTYAMRAWRFERSVSCNMAFDFEASGSNNAPGHDKREDRS